MKNLIKRIIDGERDFTGEYIEDEILSENIRNKLKEYIKSTNIEKNPIILNNANIIECDFSYIYLPYTQAKEIHISKSNFSNANLHGTNFESANIFNSYFENADLSESIIRNASVESSYFDYANFTKADIRGVRNLDLAFGLDKIQYYNTIMSQKEREIIERKLIKVNV